MSPRMTVDVAGEQVKAPVVPENWYPVKVIKAPELKVGKDSGKKYLYWLLEITGGPYSGVPLAVNTTLEKGDDPLKSKRWLFHQAMVACGVEKVNDKYSFDLDGLVGKEFYVKVIVKEESYNDNIFDKNEVKQIAKEPTQPKTAKGEKVEQDEIPF